MEEGVASVGGLGMVTIYGLADPRSGELHYIGKTAGTLRVRLRCHVNDVRRGRVYIPRHRWIAELLGEGIEPDIFEVENVADDQWKEAEQFWIAYFRAIGCRLLNATDGGDGIVGHRHSAATKEKQRRAALLRYENNEERTRTGQAVQKALSSPDSRERLRAAASRRQHRYPIELVREMQSAEGRARSSSIHLGKVVSLETRAKLSRLKTGQKERLSHASNSR